MQRGVSAWAIRNPWPVAAFFALLVGLGLYGFDKLPVTRYPAVDVPVVVVSLSDPGAGAPIIEKELAGPIESALRQVEGMGRDFDCVFRSNALRRLIDCRAVARNDVKCTSLCRQTFRDGKADPF